MGHRPHDHGDGQETGRPSHSLLLYASGQLVCLLCVVLSWIETTPRTACVVDVHNPMSYFYTYPGFIPT